MRITYLDTTKGIFVLVMVLVHVITFFAVDHTIMTLFSTFASLACFSGFLFCFGYASYLAYLRKENIPKQRMIKNSFKILVAFYISGISYRLFVNDSFNFYEILNIVLLFDIPGYSEFLLSFFLVILFSVIFSGYIREAILNKWLFLFSISLCLAFTFIDYSLVNIPQVGLIIGTTQYPAFPVIQYFPLFLLGAFFAHRQVTFSWMYTALAGFAIIEFITIALIQAGVPSRFPPSASWILGSFGLVYFYYIFSILIDKIPCVAESLRNIGSNVLYWLLTSNILIFSLTLRIDRNSLTPEKTLIIYAILVFVIYYLSTIITKPRKALQRT
jgi:hypothetical protein